MAEKSVTINLVLHLFLHQRSGSWEARVNPGQKHRKMGGGDIWVVSRFGRRSPNLGNQNRDDVSCTRHKRQAMPSGLERWTFPGTDHEGFGSDEANDNKAEHESFSLLRRNTQRSTRSGYERDERELFSTPTVHYLKYMYYIYAQLKQSKAWRLTWEQSRNMLTLPCAAVTPQ